MTDATSPPLGERIAAALAHKPDGVLEAVAASAGASLLQVLKSIPAHEVRFLPASAFENLWQKISSWGEVLMIVHTPDIVLECTGALPSGTFGHGYFNIHGESPIGGHIKASNCAAIALVDRQFHGRKSCSLQFLNAAGEAMFKVFVRRDAARQLDATQLAEFEKLWREEV
ncbi:heme utilization cystosolic carrier protein HutX [Aestuariivirga sp.]|uniref:heme utilization cystosolic carrier protein HutX n=1 Tax=Aestuariivirga sp. TaxID=2650926 RepID=UPI003BA8F137